MKKPELYYLNDADAMDSFPSEQGGEPQRVTVREDPQEALELFEAEAFAGPAPVRASVPYRSRTRVHPAVLIALAAMAALFAVIVVQQRSNGRLSLPIGSVASSTVPASEPPVTSATPAPPPTVPAPAAVLETTAATVPGTDFPTIVTVQEEPRGVSAAPEPRTVVGTPAPAPPTVSAPPTASAPPRLPRPLSQDPARLAAGVTPPSPSRAEVDVPAVSPPTTAASASPPASAPPATVAATPSPLNPPPSVTPPLSPAVTPPTAAATAPATPPAASPSTAAVTSAAPSPAAVPPSAAAPAASAAVIDTNTTGIQNTLARYRRAFSSLNASAAREVWPTVNERTLSRAFERLEQQEVSFDACQIEVNNQRGEARCNGTARYVPRVGSRTPRVERREWRFSMVKVRDEWLIGAVDAR